MEIPGKNISSTICTCKVFLNNSVSAVEALKVFVVVVAAERDGHLAADGRVPDGGEGGCESAIDPTLLEVPER